MFRSSNSFSRFNHSDIYWWEQPATAKYLQTRGSVIFLLCISNTLTYYNRRGSKIPELVDIPIPEEVEQDKINIEDSDWSPPPLTYRQVNRKRRNSTQLPDIDEEACTNCGKIKQKSWPGQDEQWNDWQNI